MNIQSLDDRFWSKVNKTDYCWLWTGCTNNIGYGRIRHGDITLLAHRVSWQIHFGEITTGLLVLHKCDNRICVNPQHLVLGTQKDNMLDASNKGRMISGEKHYNSKLTQEDVSAIKSMLIYRSCAEVGRMFGVSRNNISHIKLGQTWKDS
jgi:hypothetical protein